MENDFENIPIPERNHKEVRLYIMFENTEERDRAKAVFEQILADDKKGGAYQLPAGPDYWLPAQSHALSEAFKEMHDDENPDKSKIGLEVSFYQTPPGFNSPESFKEFLADQFASRGLRLREGGGVPEIYEVVDGVPQ